MTARSQKSSYKLHVGVDQVIRTNIRSRIRWTPFFSRYLNKKWAKFGEIFTRCSNPRSQSIGRDRISRVGSLVARKSRERRDTSFTGEEKHARLAWFFPFFRVGSLVVREIWYYRRDTISNKSEKTWAWKFWAETSRQKHQFGVFNGEFSFFWSRKRQLFEGLERGGMTSKLAIASVHHEAYASMPHPPFGPKDLYYIEKMWPNKDTSSPRQEKKMASIYHAITDPPVTKIRLWASFGV